MPELEHNPDELIAQVPDTYCNGFSAALSNADFVVTLLNRGKPIRTITMTYGVAKALGVGLLESVKKLESSGAVKVSTPAEVETVIRKLSEPKKA